MRKAIEEYPQSEDEIYTAERIRKQRYGEEQLGKLVGVSRQNKSFPKGMKAFADNILRQLGGQT